MIARTAQSKKKPRRSAAVGGQGAAQEPKRADPTATSTVTIEDVTEAAGISSITGDAASQVVAEGSLDEVRQLRAPARAGSATAAAQLAMRRRRINMQAYRAWRQRPEPEAAKPAAARGRGAEAVAGAAGEEDPASEQRDSARSGGKGREGDLTVESARVVVSAGAGAACAADAAAAATAPAAEVRAAAEAIGDGLAAGAPRTPSVDHWPIQTPRGAAPGSPAPCTPHELMVTGPPKTPKPDASAPPAE